MKRKHLAIFMGFLLAGAACFASELIITPSGPVQAGTVLHFSAVMEDWLGNCTINPGQHGPLYVSNGDSSWKSEGIVPVPGSGTQTYNFQATYTVTQTDMEDPDFCFFLCRGAMGCWAQGNVFAQKCPAKQLILKVTAPNGGESWTVGQVRNITWSANWKGTAQLRLYQDKVFRGIIALEVPSQKGSFAWSVGKTDKGTFTGKGFKVAIVRQYKLVARIVPRPPLADESDGVFTIVPINIIKGRTLR